MDVKYWDRVGKEYEKEIFSVYGNDKHAIIESRINSFFNDKHVAADVGCGIGTFLPLLSGGFKKVYANDYSRSCLKKAKKQYGKLPNVVFRKSDLTQEELGFSKAHFALCSNVIISPSIPTRLKILKNMHRHLYKKGHLFLVVPSLESALFTGFRLIDWNLKTGQSPAKAVRCGFEAGKVSASTFYQGVIDIENVGTKHYLREELQVLLTDTGFAVKDICKIEYDWPTEFHDPPAWMKAPYPWDWLVIAQKR